MRCLQLHSSLFPMHPKFKPRQHRTRHTAKLFWFAASEPGSTFPQSQKLPSSRTLMTKALPHSIVVAVTSPAKSGDLSAFLPISALLISMYFVANFIVPELLNKAFEFDKVNQEQEVDDVNAEDK